MRCEICGKETDNPRNNFLGCMTLCDRCYKFETEETEAFELKHWSTDETKKRARKEGENKK